MKIHTIVAAAKGGVIGANNQIPWYLPNDLKYFKKVTLGHPIIMGRKNFESIGRTLPKRSNIIITRNPFYAVSNAFVVHSLTEALELAHQEEAEIAFIIGGGEIYRQAMPLVEKIYYTAVDLEVEGDVFFPELSDQEWELESEEHHFPDEKNAHPHTFKVYVRK